MTLDEAQQQGIAPWDDEIENLQGVRVYRDRYPVTSGHLLFVPESDQPVLITQCFQLAYLQGLALKNRGECNGFNIGFNLGSSAGQTVMYPHVHLILRRSGDCNDPVGGVRGVIPGQANYKDKTYKSPLSTDK
jgi:diadenosine tetraphosphate (Ap4A) HIT family hydrolase